MLQPLLLLDIVRVANDALAFLLGTIVVLIRVNLRADRFWIRVVALSLALAFAILSKFTNASLVPVVLLSFILLILRGKCRVVPAVFGLTIVFLVTAIILSPYLLFNLHTFGLITPMQEAVANRGAGRSLETILETVPLYALFVWTLSWWVINGLWVGGWSFLFSPRIFEIAYASLLLVAGCSALIRWHSLQFREGSKWMVVFVIVCVQAGLTLHAAESYSAWGGQVLTNSCYAAVAVPWFLILLGSGAFLLRYRTLRSCVLLGVPIVFLLIENYGVFFLMLPKYYAASALSVTTVRRIATFHPALLGPVTWITSTIAALTLAILFGLANIRNETFCGPASESSVK